MNNIFAHFRGKLVSTGEAVVLSIDKAIPRWRETVDAEKAIFEKANGPVEWEKDQ